MINKDTAQLVIEELKNELEQHKRMLDKRDLEIERLQKLLDEAASNPKQDDSAPPANYKEGLDLVYEIISGLERYTTEEVLFYAAPALAALMETKDVAVYMVVNKDYARLFSATSPKARKLGNSIKYTSMHEMHRVLEAGRIYINEDMDASLPLMAGGIYAEEEIQVILMFWGIPQQQMNRLTANRLTVITALIQNALLRAKRCMAGFRRRNYVEGTNVLNEEAFTALVRTFLDAKAKGLTECALAEIVMGYQEYETIAAKIACNIRQTDYMGIMGNEKLYILLSNTDITNAEVVKERLLKLGYQCILKETLL